MHNIVAGNNVHHCPQGWLYSRAIFFFLLFLRGHFSPLHNFLGKKCRLERHRSLTTFFVIGGSTQWKIHKSAILHAKLTLRNSLFGTKTNAKHWKNFNDVKRGTLFTNCLKNLAKQALNLVRRKIQISTLKWSKICDIWIKFQPMIQNRQKNWHNSVFKRQEFSRLTKRSWTKLKVDYRKFCNQTGLWIKWNSSLCGFYKKKWKHM